MLGTFFFFIQIQCTKYIRMFHLAKKVNIKDTLDIKSIGDGGMGGGGEQWG